MSEISRFEYRAIRKLLIFRKAASEQHLWTFGKRLRGQCRILFDCHQVGCWILTWPNITWKWHPSWTASRSDHWWLLPCYRKASDGGSTTESLGDSHRSGRFIWHHLEYFVWTFGFKQGPCQMGPMFSDTRSEVISGGHMFGAVGYLQCNPGQRVVPYNNWWWNAYSTLGLIHHPGVDAVETRQLSSAKEVPHSTVGWKVMATIFWDCKGVLLVDYIPQKTTMTGPYYGEVLTNLRHEWRRSGGKFWPEVRCCCTIMRQRTSRDAQSRTSGLNSCLAHLTHPTWHPATSTYFDIWSSTFVERGFLMMMSCSRPRSHISTTCPGILFDWNKRTFWQMWKVYWCTGRLHWNIM